MTPDHASDSWAELRVLCPVSEVVSGGRASGLDELLLRLSPGGFVREDDDAPPGEREPPPKGWVRFTCYVLVQDQEAVMSTLRAAVASVQEARVDARPLDPNWRESWKKYFLGFRASPRLWVRPPWEESQGQAEVVIEPGMAFGTGQHETTKLCLAALDRATSDDRDTRSLELLDVGCGTGILAIGAIRLGFQRAVGVDHDVDAVRIAVENADMNHVGQACAFSATPIERVPGAYPIVVANIMAPPLIAMATPLSERVAGAGRLFLSGILVHQAADVVSAYEERGLRHIRQDRAGDWVLLEFSRP